MNLAPAEHSSRAKPISPKPPWQSPVRLLWFVLALGAACWLILHMPEQTTTPAQTARPILSATPAQQAQLAQPAQPSVRHTRKTPQPPQTSFEKVFTRVQGFASLFAMVGIAAFVGALIESRRWHMVLAKCMGVLTHMARLPEIVGLAMPTALFSNAAANSMLVSSYADGHIRRSALVAGGMANSYLAYVSHSVRVMYPVLGAIGWPGLMYFASQFAGGLLVIVAVMCWNRWYVNQSQVQVMQAEPLGVQAESPIMQGKAARNPPGAKVQVKHGTALPLWSETVRRSLVRAASLLFRMVCITVPLMISIEWLIKSGAFDFWEHYVPEQVNRFFPAELMFVVAAQMGGLVQSALVSANLRAEGIIDNAQILLAMLVGSAIGNPFRTMRRNLPSALGIFPPREALTVVLGMQCARFVTTLILIVLVVGTMHYVLYTE